MTFLDVPFTLDPDAAVDEQVAFLQSVVPGWELADGQFEAFLLEATARITVEAAQIASQVPAGVFAGFATRFLGITQKPGAPAIATSTWTLVDSAGYLIPAGTVVAHRTSGDTADLFATTVDVTVAPGATTAAGVQLEALESGSDANGIASGTSLELVDALAYVTAVVTSSVSAGGQDAEVDAAYLDRAAAEAQLLSLTPILPGDFAVLAGAVDGVARAIGVSGYNPDDGTDGNERYLAVALVDASGNAVPSPVKAAAVTYLDGLREVNFVVKAFDPTYTTVNVTFSIRVAAGYASVDVVAACSAAIAAYLNPANWAGGGQSPPVWNLGEGVVRYLEVATLLREVAGVAYVASVQLNGASADVTLTGKAPLPQSGTITGSSV